MVAVLPAQHSSPAVLDSPVHLSPSPYPPTHSSLVPRHWLPSEWLTSHPTSHPLNLYKMVLASFPKSSFDCWQFSGIMTVHQYNIQKCKSWLSLILPVLVFFWGGGMFHPCHGCCLNVWFWGSSFACELCFGIIDLCICFSFILRIYLLFIHELPNLLFVLPLLSHMLTTNSGMAQFW
jgi:hypothetical protein